MKKPLVLFSTDWHIKPNNTEQIIDLVKQKIKVALDNSIKILIVLGDIFQSRQAQPLIVLKCFEKILDLVHEAELELWCISGNHDKTDYTSQDSFLDQFQWHPALKLIRVFEVEQIGDWLFYFLPYFETEIWKDMIVSFEELEIKSDKKILCSHQAVNGSVNNDGSKINNGIEPNALDEFYKVFLGHYHNQQKISGHIYHLPSIQSNNFGEDNEKGFTILYDDGSHELIQSEFKQYYTIDIDLDKLNKNELNNIKKDANELIKETGANIRFKFKGSEDKIKAIKQEEFTALGIDVKKEHKSVTDSIEKAVTGEVMVYNNDIIIKKFEEFCIEEEYDNVEYGKSCLIKKLKENE